MSTIRPFRAYRPKPEYASEVAAKPYDVLNSDEAREEAKGHPLSFLHVGKPEIDLEPDIDLYDKRVYEKGKENLNRLISQGVLVEDTEPYLYVYAQTMDGRTQYGLVGCASVEEYWNGSIKDHELTRKDKEEDRYNHIRITNSHSGPIFLIYRDNLEINSIISEIVRTPAENDHIASDGVHHQCWVIKDKKVIDRIVTIFKSIPNLYIADGHHRSAAAARVAKERAENNPNHTGNEEYNFFLAAYFPASQLKIFDYNRLVKDLNGLSKDDFLTELKKAFTVVESSSPVKPTKKGDFGMYLDYKWYVISANSELLNNPDSIQRLDVSILQTHLLDSILGIKDPRTDKRIDFVAGIRGLGELERRVNSREMRIAFSMYPCSLEEIIQIADEGKAMPPKSTWFEPKLRDGLFVHFLD